MKNTNKLIVFSTVAAALGFAAAYLYRKKQEKEEALVFADENADAEIEEDLRDLFREYKEDAAGKETDAEEEADANEGAGEEIDVVEVKVEGIFDDVEKDDDEDDDDDDDSEEDDKDDEDDSEDKDDEDDSEDDDKDDSEDDDKDEENSDKEAATESSAE